MGFILSKFRRKKKTQEVLEGIEKEINRITASKKQNVASQNSVIKYILTYGVVFWLLALGCIYYLYRSAKKRDEYILLLPLVILIPCLLFLFRRILSWWYHRKIVKEDSKLIKLKDEKTKILEEVMEKETYKVATQILEKFDPSRLSASKQNQGERGVLSGRPLGGGMDVRKRPQPQAQNLNTSLALPNKPVQRPATNLNQTIATMPTTVGANPPVPAAALRGPAAGRGGPPLPRPILPRDRGYLDKFVEYLVGDGPANRYALICRQCQSHNGMALREEFEYISYRCCYCHYWNPARKQRPVAPRLPDPSIIQSTDVDSSDESSKSERNSVAGSRRSSITEDPKFQEVKQPDDATMAASQEISPATETEAPSPVLEEKENSAEDSAEEDADCDSTSELIEKPAQQPVSDSDHIELINKDDLREDAKVTSEMKDESMDIDT